MAQVTADFETGTNGNTIATSDTGSATAWDSVFKGTGAGAVYDNTHKYGNLAAKLTTGGTSTSVELRWDAAFPDQSGTHYGRAYMWLNETPAASRIVVYGQTAVPNTCFRININTSRQIELLDNSQAVKATSTTTITTGQWFRLEWKVIQGAGTSGTIECKIFTSPDSSTADETVTASGVNTQATCTQIEFGLVTNSTNKTMWMDNIVAAATSYPGPAGGSAPANTVAPAVTGLVAVGKTLTSTAGTWTDDGSGVKTYQWKHADDSGFTTNVANATNSSTSSTYVVASGEKLKYLRCTVTDTDGVGETSANSNVVGPVGTSTGTLAGRMEFQGLIVDDAAVVTALDDSGALLLLLSD